MISVFADVYDHLMADINYISWAEFYSRIMSRNGIHPGAEIVECACGTGGLTIPLKRLGYRITGLDINEDMLRVAADKTRAEGLLIPYVNMDMCDLCLHHAVDAVLCTCDGVNYLTSADEVLRFYTKAASAIKPGGCFIFDISSHYKLSGLLANHLVVNDTDKLTYIWDSHYHAGTKRCEIALTIFIKEKDNRYIRIDEQQIQRAHTLTEITAWLAAAGFQSPPEILGEFGLAAVKKHDLRQHIIARK